MLDGKYVIESAALTRSLYTAVAKLEEKFGIDIPKPYTVRIKSAQPKSEIMHSKIAQTSAP